MTPRLLPAEAIRTIAAIARGETGRNSIWSPPPKPPTLTYDPEEIRERFHRDSRGVQTLSAWLATGGGTPKFFDAVNQVIAEDGDFEALITGLINMSALLAHMAAGALGTSTEALVGGLLDLYGQFDDQGKPKSD